MYTIQVTLKCSQQGDNFVHVMSIIVRANQPGACPGGGAKGAVAPPPPPLFEMLTKEFFKIIFD